MFLSLQKIHINAIGTAFHPLHLLLLFPAYQKNNRSFTDLGITLLSQLNISHQRNVESYKQKINILIRLLA